MYVYRISQTKYSTHLSPSGIYGRWNSAGQRMIYTAGSVALACLENVVHRSGAALSVGNFSISIIDIKNTIRIEEVPISQLTDLSSNWTLVENYHLTQKLGDQWLQSQSSAVLKIPSAIIDLEYNYLLNPQHADFSKIRIVETNAFKFDPRLKSEP